MNARHALSRLFARRMLLMGFPNSVVEDCANIGSSQLRALRHEIKVKGGLQPPSMRGPVRQVKSLTARASDHLQASLAMAIYCSIHSQASSRVDIDAVIEAFKIYRKELGAIKAAEPRAKHLKALDMASTYTLANALCSHEGRNSAEMMKCKSCFASYYMVYEREATLRCPYCEWRVRGMKS